MFRWNFKSSNYRLCRIINLQRFSNRFLLGTVVIQPIRARVGYFENQPIDNIAVVSLSAAKRNRIVSAFQWFRMSLGIYESWFVTLIFYDSSISEPWPLGIAVSWSDCCCRRRRFFKIVFGLYRDEGTLKVFPISYWLKIQPLWLVEKLDLDLCRV